MRDLNISLLQTRLHWEQARRNREHFASLLAQLDSDCDLAILPEMFTTGFSMNAEELAEDDGSDTIAWMTERARARDMALMGSLAVRSQGRVFNRLLFVTPEADVQSYDKRHLFRMSGEHEHYAAGSERLVVSWRGWRLCPMICYDLRFPVWSRDRGDYDALILCGELACKTRYALASVVDCQGYRKPELLPWPESNRV